MFSTGDRFWAGEMNEWTVFEKMIGSMLSHSTGTRPDDTRSYNSQSNFFELLLKVYWNIAKGILKCLNESKNQSTICATGESMDANWMR